MSFLSKIENNISEITGGDVIEPKQFKRKEPKSSSYWAGYKLISAKFTSPQVLEVVLEFNKLESRILLKLFKGDLIVQTEKGDFYNVKTIIK